MMRKVSGVALHQENHCGVYPCCAMGSGRYRIESGWKLVGWGSAPWQSGAGRKEAIVFEKTSPASEDMLDAHGHLEPGTYWCYGDPEKFKLEKA